MFVIFHAFQRYISIFVNIGFYLIQNLNFFRMGIKPYKCAVLTPRSTRFLIVFRFFTKMYFFQPYTRVTLITQHFFFVHRLKIPCSGAHFFTKRLKNFCMSKIFCSFSVFFNFFYLVQVADSEGKKRRLYRRIYFFFK